MDEKEKIKEVVKEREEKIELLNRSFDEKDKLIQDLESRFVLIALRFKLKYQKGIQILCDKLLMAFWLQLDIFQELILLNS